jgi:hypothetical protein
MKRFLIIPIFIIINSVISGAEPVAKVENGLIFANFEGERCIGVGLPKRCELYKQISNGEKLYLLIYKARKSWGSDFEMLISMEKTAGNSKVCVIKILITEKDLRQKGKVRSLDDIKIVEDKLQLRLAEYDSIKRPTDVHRSWIELPELLTSIDGN